MTPLKKTENKKEKIIQEYFGKESFLILHNDDYNTFDYVINCLMEICNHNREQAEQCALITHHNGKCDIKKGPSSLLLNQKEELLNMGLSVTLE